MAQVVYLLKASRVTNVGCRLAATILLALLAAPALGGPPFLTDDPEPTDPGHWEIYGPAMEIEGRGSDYGGSAGVELNYGLIPNVQLTLGLPLAFAHDAGGSEAGLGDVEASLKYRIVNDDAGHFQLAVFPGVTLPTARSGLGPGRVTALLPVWAQKDLGPWSIFGGGGYAINRVPAIATTGPEDSPSPAR